MREIKKFPRSPSHILNNTVPKTKAFRWFKAIRLNLFRSHKWKEGNPWNVYSFSTHERKSTVHSYYFEAAPAFKFWSSVWLFNHTVSRHALYGEMLPLNYNVDYSEGKWSSHPPIQGVSDWVCIAFSQLFEFEFYAAIWGSGILWPLPGAIVVSQPGLHICYQISKQWFFSFFIAS